MIIVAAAVTFVFLVMLGAALRAYLVNRMAASFDLGMKLGQARATLGQDVLDAMLRDCGIEPESLPHRAAK